MKCNYYRQHTVSGTWFCDAGYPVLPIPVLSAVMSQDMWYRPEADAVAKYCTTENFMDCPRFKASLEFWRAIKGV